MTDEQTRLSRSARTARPTLTKRCRATGFQSDRWIVALILFLFVASDSSPAFAYQADVPKAEPVNVVEPLPAKPPEWLPGYQVRYALRRVGNAANSKAQSIVARLPTGTWLRPDGLDVAVQAADGTTIPVALLSHAATGETLIQFAAKGADVWYWAYAVNAGAPAAAGKPLPEGIVLEAMDWPGGDLASWTTVRDGLTKAGPVLAAGFVPEIMQKSNPARPDQPKKYAVTYRGHLTIKTDGVYRFFVNSEDASFLFIDGFKVCERVGSNPRVTGNIPTKSVGNDVELKAGVHPIEVYHAMAETPYSYGGCTLLWAPPGAKTWVVVPRDQFVQPDVAIVADIEAAGPATAAVIEYGIDDVLVTPAGATLHLVRFEACGDLPDEKSLVWDFGDGTKGTGRSVRHVYFSAGDYKVTLSGATLPAYQRRVHVWAAPGSISPFSVTEIIRNLQQSDWKTLPGDRIDQIVDFLATADDPTRWPFLAEISRERLKASDLDPQLRAQLYRTLIEAIGHTGKPRDMEPVVKQALTDFAKLPTLQVGIELAEATALLREFNNPDDAAKRFEATLKKHRRLEHPDMRWVAIRYGDLLSERGELKAAADMYRTAATLGGEAFLATATTEAVSRGALLRLAEQKLRTGNIAETRQLLAKIELQYPDQKMEGLYRFLRAESDRFAGRYDDALRSYDVLMQLTQWAGYRDRAMRGIADCHARKDEVDKALEWLAKIEKAFPAFYEKQGLDGQRLILTARREWLKENKGRDPADLRRYDFNTRFEPDEKEPFGKSDMVKVVRGMGLAGPHVALLEAHPAYLGYLTWNRPLPALSPGGHYWVECWYREDFLDLVPGFNAHMYLYLYGPGTQIHPTRGQMTYFLERSFGSWRKVGFAIDAPTANEGRLTMSVLSVGATQIDGLSLRAVTDRQLDALSNFIEGPGDGASP